MQNTNEILLFTEAKLKNQVRKCGEPSFTHALEVADISKSICIEMASIYKHLSQEINQIYIAGLLHDVIEDTDATYDDIVDIVDNPVAEWVSTLSEDTRLERSIRQYLYNRSIRTACIQVQIVKLADVYSNLRSLDKISDKNWVRNFRKKAKAILDSLSLELNISEIYKKCYDFSAINNT